MGAIDVVGGTDTDLESLAQWQGELALVPTSPAGWLPFGGLDSATRGARLAKRVLDVVGATILLVLLSPVLLLAMLAIVVTSPGSAFHAQDRIGEGGHRFRFYKLRTMRVGSHQRRFVDLAEQSEIDGPVFKMKDDPRITGVGRILRKFSIDELPQLFNVVRGDMSLVGPRPALPEEVEAYSAREMARLRVPQGLTCLWQVSGRSDLTFDEWMELDLRYINTWTWWQDLVILVRTIPAVMFARGAY